MTKDEYIKKMTESRLDNNHMHLLFYKFDSFTGGGVDVIIERKYTSKIKKLLNYVTIDQNKYRAYGNNDEYVQLINLLNKKRIKYTEEEFW